MQFAVIKTGGKQYKVAANDVVKVEKLDGQPGDVITFDQVLMVGDGDAVTVGAPLVEGATVAAHFVATEKERTVLIIKKHRRQHYDRRNGHRQRLSTVRIAEILVGGAQPTVAADERLRARYAAKQQATASVSEAATAPVVASAATEAAAPAEVKVAKPRATKAKAADVGEAAPAKETKAKAEPKAKAEKKPAAKKAAPQADNE